MGQRLGPEEGGCWEGTAREGGGKPGGAGPRRGSEEGGGACVMCGWVPMHTGLTRDLLSRIPDPGDL